MIKEIVLDLFFPKYCLGCGKEGQYICKDCDLYVTENSFVCPVCLQASFLGQTHEGCLGKYSPNGLISIWDYNGIVKEVIKRIKYGGEFDMVKECIDKFILIMANDSVNRLSLFTEFMGKSDAVIYVPMFKKKEARRGYNQAEIIAKEIGKRFGKPVVKLLDKIRDTEDQASLGKEERVKNIKNAFSITRQIDKPGLSIVLVDDVFTTGATMGECCKILKQNGVSKVLGFTLARPI
jgi:competence protein ComFC